MTGLFQIFTGPTSRIYRALLESVQGSFEEFTGLFQRVYRALLKTFQRVYRALSSCVPAASLGRAAADFAGLFLSIEGLF